MKRTEKIMANSRQKSMANSRQKSTANSRQKSIANGRQDKSRANDRQSNQRTATETWRSSRISTIQKKAAAIQPASPEASKNRCRCPAGAGRSDCPEAATQKVQKIVKDSHDDSQLSSTKTAGRSTMKSIWIDKKLTRSCVFSISQDRKRKAECLRQRKSERLEFHQDTEVIHRKVKGRTKNNCYMKENRSEFSETCRLKDLVKEHSERGTRRRAALHVVRNGRHQRRQ